MKILVLNPSSSATKNVIRDVLYGCWCKGKRIGGATVPPFALLEIATILQNEEHDVEFLDAQAEQLPLELVERKVIDCDAAIISTSTMSFTEDANTLLALKAVNENLTTVMFGSHPSFMPTYSLAHDGPDIIVRHEPEFIIRDLFRALRNGGDEWKSIKGIGFRQNGEHVLNEEYPFIDLDELPYPDVTMLPQGIDYYNPLVRRMPYITTTTSKGCPAKCTFCTAPYFDGMKVRFQSADYVLGEIEHFLEHGFREVYFRDDTFFVWKKRDIEICEEIVKRGLDVTWIANARVSMIDKEMMQRAKDAGCHTIKFGIESGVQEILDRMRKGYTIDQAYEVFESAQKQGSSEPSRKNRRDASSQSICAVGTAKHFTRGRTRTRISDDHDSHQCVCGTRPRYPSFDHRSVRSDPTRCADHSHPRVHQRCGHPGSCLRDPPVASGGTA